MRFQLLVKRRRSHKLNLSFYESGMTNNSETRGAKQIPVVLKVEAASHCLRGEK